MNKTMRIHLLAIIALLLAIGSRAQTVPSNQLFFGDFNRKTGKRILYIGDSITDGGWGNSGGSAKPSDKRNHWDQNHLLGHSYVMLCAARYTADHPTEDATFLNRGISGDSLMGLKMRWQQDVLDLHPDVLSVLIGTNDVNEWLRGGHGQPFDFARWEAAYRTLIDAARGANPAVKVVLCSPFVAASGKVGQAADFALRQETIAQLGRIVARICVDYNATFVDFHALYARLQKQAPRADYWIWDGIHPTPAGHQQMADLWLSATALK